MYASGVALGLLVSGAVLTGCQAILGFQPFEARRSSDGGPPRPAPTTTSSGGAPSSSDAAPGGTTGGCPNCSDGSPTTSGCTSSCAGKDVALVANSCSEGFLTGRRCDPAQCDPNTGDCITLDIDRTEVSMSAYAAWLGTSPDLAAQPKGCGWNTSFALDPGCLQEGTDRVLCTSEGCNSPVVCIDWCDAYAFCAAEGRRLCGRIGGGMNPRSESNAAGESEWFNGCSAAGQFAWFSGSSVPGACTYSGNANAPYDVGTRDSCASPSPGYSSLRDMAGNVAEWEDSCDRPAQNAEANASDECLTRGGSYQDALAATACEATSARLRNTTAFDLGFRCCGLGSADAAP